jgi:hypothetical protein
MAVTTNRARIVNDTRRKRMAGHTPWREIERKSQMQNGSRLGEHRKPRVSIESWLLLVGVIAGMLALGANATKAQEFESHPLYKPFSLGTGVLVNGAELCFSPDLSQPTIDLLGTWQRLVNEYEAYEIGGAVMDEEDAIYAQILSDTELCATIADYYDITITQAIEGYVLAKFDEQYGFRTGTFIVAKKDIIPDRGI